jgi:hypothetical protein
LQLYVFWRNPTNAQFEHIWLDPKERLPEYLAKEPANMDYAVNN